MGLKTVVDDCQAAIVDCSLVFIFVYSEKELGFDAE